MISFKEQLGKDLEVFINIDEFGNIHDINGEAIKCVVDEDLVEERGLSKEEQSFAGVYDKVKSIFVMMSDIEKPIIGEQLILDGEMHLVKNVKTTELLYEIEIERRDY